jgi:hypothetical protein
MAAVRTRAWAGVLYIAEGWELVMEGGHLRLVAQPVAATYREVALQGWVEPEDVREQARMWLRRCALDEELSPAWRLLCAQVAEGLPQSAQAAQQARLHALSRHQSAAGPVA